MVDFSIIIVLVLTEVTRGHLADSPEVVHHLLGPAIDPRGAPPGAVVAPAGIGAPVVPDALVAEGEDALRLRALALPTGTGTVSGKVQGI